MVVPNLQGDCVLILASRSPSGKKLPQNGVWWGPVLREMNREGVELQRKEKRSRLHFMLDFINCRLI
jgi:hypothetical protein